MQRFKFIITLLSLAWVYAIGRRIARRVRSKDAPMSAEYADQASQEADSPRELTKSDWKQALKETKAALRDKNLPMLAAGVAFFTTLSFFPMLAALVAIAAMVIDQSQLQSVVTAIETYMPKDIASLISTQLTTLTGKEATNTLVAVFAILLSVYSASAAVQNLINATNRTYDVDESRSFIKLKLISLGLTLGGILLAFVLIPVLIVTADFLRGIGLPNAFAEIFPYLRWLLVVAIISVSLATFYRYGPDRRDPKWQWVSWGAAAATLIWLIGTALFFFYAQNFASFSQSYGIFAGIIVLMTWLNLSAFIFLLGGEINHRLEEQTDAPTEA